jgi:hypothetical protein
MTTRYEVTVAGRLPGWTTNSEPADPIETTAWTDPTEPIDRTDPFEPMDKTGSSDHADHSDHWDPRRAPVTGAPVPGRKGPERTARWRRGWS